MSEIQFETAQVVALQRYPRNARRRARDQILKIAASIDEFGFTNPILVDEKDEIIAGHGRLEAAIHLKLTTVPVLRVSGLSDVQKKGLRLADNKLGEGSSWDPELLKLELADLTLTDFDVTLTAFETIEIDKWLTPDLGLDSQDRELPPVPAHPVSRLGDLWALGESRLVVGDARDRSVYRLLLGLSLADMVMSDPPYNVKIKGNVGGKGNIKHGEFQMASGEMDDAAFDEFLSVVFGLARDHCRDGSLHYICADWRMIGLLTGVGKKLFAQLMNIATWIKPNPAMGSFYRSQHEMVAIFKHGTAAHINNIQLGRMGRNRSNVWQYPGGSGFSKTRQKDLEDHPTVKPLALVADAIRDATKPGDLVLDPFGGSGTTLIAAELTKRHAALIEIEPKYADVTLRRFQEHTGVEPVLLPDRIPFSAVRAERNTDQKDAA